MNWGTCHNHIAYLALTCDNPHHQWQFQTLWDLHLGCRTQCSPLQIRSLQSFHHSVPSLQYLPKKSTSYQHSHVLLQYVGVVQMWRQHCGNSAWLKFWWMSSHVADTVTITLERMKKSLSSSSYLQLLPEMPATGHFQQCNMKQVSSYFVQEKLAVPFCFLFWNLPFCIFPHMWTISIEIHGGNQSLQSFTFRGNMVTRSGASMLYQMQRLFLLCATTTSLPGTHCT